MTAPTQDTLRKYAEDGATTSFAIPFQFGDGEVNARRDYADGTSIDLVADADFTVTGGDTIAAGVAGTLTTAVAAAAGVTLLLWRETARDQQTNFVDIDRYPGSEQEAALDKVTRIVQEHDRDFGRSLLLPIGDAGATLPAAADRGSTTVGFDADGNAVVRSADDLAIDLVPVLPPYLKGAPGANVDAVGLFSQLVTQPVGTGTDVIGTTGHTSTGIGVGQYVSDTLATAALALTCPRACQIDENGRYFRLLGTPDGFVTPEMFGCPTYAAGTNHQPYIQAAIDYCKAMFPRLKGVYFPQAHYELWSNPRTGYAAGNAFDFTCNTGEFMLVDGHTVALVGNHPRKTTLHFKGPTGGSLLTDYQTVTATSYGGDVIWRGSGVKLTGSVGWGQARPDEDTLSSVTVKNLIFLTDIVGVRNLAYPGLPLSRDSTGARQNCWDNSNKGIYCQQNMHIGDVYLEDVEFRGFQGENVYSTSYGNNYNQRVTIRNCLFRDTNAQALNPNGPRSFEVDGLYAENCGFGIEGWFGHDSGRLANAYFKDCTGIQLSGSFGTAMAARNDGSEPILRVENVTFDNCGTISLGSYVKGSCKNIDTVLSLLPATTDGLVQCNDLDVTAERHRTSLAATPRCIRVNQSIGAAGCINRNNIRLRAQRSQAAITNGLTWLSLFEQAGALGSGNRLALRGGGGSSLGIVSATITGQSITMVDEGLELGSASAVLTNFDPSTTPSPDWTVLGYNASAFSAGSGVYTVNLPAIALFDKRSELILSCGVTGGYMIAKDPTTAKNLCLIGAGQTARFRLGPQSTWELVTPVAPITATASIDVTSTAAAAESGPYSIPHPASQPYMHARVVPASILTGFVISAIRAEAAAVKFWVRNIDGGATLDPAAQVFTASVSL